MATKMHGRYLGDKNVEIVHELSGSVIKTAAPLDNNGDGSSFSPTDLLASSLGACMITIIGIVAEKRGIQLTNARFELAKIMHPHPRKISSIPLKIWLPASLESSERRLLEEAAYGCPVCKSIHPDISVKVEFVYE